MREKRLKSEAVPKVRVAVLMGGPSAEHDISLKTGEQVLEYLDKKKYQAKAVKISKEGKWDIPPAELAKKFDIVFLALHGEYGEDGTVQAILDKQKIKYTGSGARASKLGMDKGKSAAAFKKAGLVSPRFVLMNKDFVFNFGYPVVVKPNDRGSSVGISIVDGFHDLTHALEIATQVSKDIMIQQFISGREMTCGVLEIDGKLTPLTPTEIIPRSAKFFDYEAKYVAGASREISPPKVSRGIIKKIQQSALKAHKVIGCAGYSRTDFILGNDKKLYVLEINTLPGLTETSLVPQEAKALGIRFPKLLDLIIDSAL